MKVEIVRSTAAEQLLSDPNFRSEWEALCDRCPWATAFQSSRFLRVWWSVYGRLFEPVLLISRWDDGSIAGLLALARSRADGSLIVAGGRHAEYQSWVCDPAASDVFPKEALAKVRQEFPGAGLTFQYLPSGTPILWLRDRRVGRLCLLRAHRRPLWELGDGRGIAASLKKSSNKNRLRHLKKLGLFEFRRITDPLEFDRLFDEMIELYDLRHGAVHGSQPFCSVEHQKEFHTALFRETGLLHATVMRAGGKLAAAHFGVCGTIEIHFGTIVHDPRLANHSPGKLQYLLMAELLQREGFRRADLTPGDDAYKERHATDWDCVHTLSLCPGALSRAKLAAALRVAGGIKRLLKRRGTTTVEARNRLRRFGGPARAASLLLKSARAWIVHRQETHIYLHDVDADEHAPVDPAGHSHNLPIVRVDAWRDLLAYQPTGTGPCRQAFLSRVLSRLEAGEHAYTVTEGGRLVHLWWTAHADSDAAPIAGFAVPPASLLVQDAGLFESAISAPAWAAALRAILSHARENAHVRRVVVLAPPETSADDALRRAGFVHGGSIRRTTWLGRKRVRIEQLNGVAASVASASIVAAASPEGRYPIQSAIPLDPEPIPGFSDATAYVHPRATALQSTRAAAAS